MSSGPAEVFAGVSSLHGGEGEGYDVRARGGRRGGGFAVTSGVSGFGGVDPRPGFDRAPTTPSSSRGGEDGAVRAAGRVAGRSSRGSRARWSDGSARRFGLLQGAFYAVAGEGGAPRWSSRRDAPWSACHLLAAFRPQLTVDPNAIFVQEGRIWTSAGVTTGIDMALAMVEEDHGRRVADAIAARLVLYARRPGFQSQFSETLVAQTAASDPFAPVVAWARGNLRGHLDTARLARRAGMSVRTFPPPLH